MLTLKKTPLNEEHKKLNARLVDFAGFEMPVQYSGIIAEHNAVRENAGIFDVSHMGEFLVKGKDCIEYLNKLVPNDITKLKKSNKGLYTQICREDGGTVDDLIIYKRPVGFLVVVNASNIEKDWAWFNKHTEGFEVELENISEETALIAVQGPNAEKYLSKAVVADLSGLGSFEIMDHRSFWIARTGYTGEDGFEIFIRNNPMKTAEVWEKLLAQSAAPCGLGARDTLRLEVVYPLYGHELDDETSPIEAGLGWTVKFDSGDFIGKEALQKQKEDGVKKKFTCLKINSKMIARDGYKVCTKDGKEIGKVCSGSQGITVGFPIATAYIEPSEFEIGKELAVDIRGKLIPCEIVKRPFYKKS